MIGIKAITSYFSGEKTSIQDLSEMDQLQGEELEYYNHVGIKTIYNAEDTSSYQLALGASQKLINQEDITGNHIDVIIFIKSRLPDHFISSEATRLKHDIGADNALTFSVSDLGCVDSTLAIKMAKDLLTANPLYKNVLITYGSKKFTPERFRYPVTLTGDGGMACLIGRTEHNKILDVQIESNGNYWDLFKIEYQDRSFEDYKEVCSDTRKYGFELALESRNRFSELNKRILSDSGLVMDDVKNVMMQNISARAYTYYEDAFNIKLSPFCKMNLSQYGHLGSADIVLNYQLGLQSKMIKKDSYALLMNNSPVAAWSSILIQA